ncbi:MAG: hypothetical protein CMP53_04330 [Flavobacteriales bacterium]|nr:hypothetical protein [Flavobacteriales bacterium]
MIKKAKAVLKEFWGYDDFRGLQGAIIQSVLLGKDTLGMLPTGGGKSICYQVPGLLYPGTTLVISPLVALMEDQHKGLLSRGIKSYHFKGSYPVRKLDEAFRNLRYGKYKFAFIAPERLGNALFREYIANADISLLAVDEAHCISQWGFDFRPSYLNIQKIKELLPEIPTIALTATATKRVKKDLINELRIPDAEVFEGSVLRENLILHKKFTPNKERQILRLLKKLEGTGIIYAKTRRTCEQLSNLLNIEGFKSCYYHAGVDGEIKAKNQEDWMTNQTNIMVATTAFGMGIDKGDVSWVIHWDVPDTLEGYYQEIGRAGRNGKNSKTYLLFNQHDFERLNQSLDELPNIKGVEDFYRAFCSKHQIAVGAGLGLRLEFSLVELADKMNLSIPNLLTYIKLIQHRKLWQFIESEQSVPRIQFHSNPSQWKDLRSDWKEILIALYRMYPNAVEHHQRIDRKRFAAMAQVRPKEFDDILTSLNAKGLITFTPEKLYSTIVFAEPRPLNKHMRFPESFVNAYITSKRERTDAMLDVLQNEDCLNRQIACYFGQENQINCNTCSNCTLNHYPDEEVIKKMLSKGHSFDDIWFDLNCNPDALRK